MFGLTSPQIIVAAATLAIAVLILCLLVAALQSELDHLAHTTFNALLSPFTAMRLLLTAGRGAVAASAGNCVTALRERHADGATAWLLLMPLLDLTCAVVLFVAEGYWLAFRMNAMIGAVNSPYRGDGLDWTIAGSFLLASLAIKTALAESMGHGPSQAHHLWPGLNGRTRTYVCGALVAGLLLGVVAVLALGLWTASGLFYGHSLRSAGTVWIISYTIIILLGALVAAAPYKAASLALIVLTLGTARVVLALLHGLCILVVHMGHCLRDLVIALLALAAKLGRLLLHGRGGAGPGAPGLP